MIYVRNYFPTLPSPYLPSLWVVSSKWNLNKHSYDDASKKWEYSTSRLHRKWCFRQWEKLLTTHIFPILKRRYGYASSEEEKPQKPSTHPKQKIQGPHIQQKQLNKQNLQYLFRKRIFSWFLVSIVSGWSRPSTTSRFLKQSTKIDSALSYWPWPL